MANRQLRCKAQAELNAFRNAVKTPAESFHSGNHCICGGRQLIRGRDYTVSFVSGPQVKDVAAALAKITRAWMRKRYDQIDPADYDEVEMGDEDFGYTWANFLNIRRLYKKAAKAGRAVIFTVD